MEADGTVRERVFEDCDIIGPASIVPIGTENSVIDCSFVWSNENFAQFHSRPVTKDIVLVLGCTFRRCRFADDVDVSRLMER